MSGISAGYTLPGNLQDHNLWDSTFGDGATEEIIAASGRTRLWGLSVWATGGVLAEVVKGATVGTGDVIFSVASSGNPYGQGLQFPEGLVWQDGTGLWLRNNGAGEAFFYATVEPL